MTGTDDESNAMIDDIMTASEEDEDANVVDELIGGRPMDKTPKPEAAGRDDGAPAGDDDDKGDAEDAPIIY
jgi:hypothetical protein